MNRKPETKKAAQLITAAFAAQGVKLGHQAALNLLATLEGYESFAQMKAAQVDIPQARPAEKTESFTAHIVFGEDECSVLRDAEEPEEMAKALDPAKSYTFPTADMLGAFLDGVEEACGWLEYRNVTSLVQAKELADEETRQAEESEAVALLRRNERLHNENYHRLMRQFLS